jgi:hypothetical protein
MLLPPRFPRRNTGTFSFSRSDCGYILSNSTFSSSLGHETPVALSLCAHSYSSDLVCYSQSLARVKKRFNVSLHP